eukprot:TRINITY_DN14216_c0_g1_i1.p1 TRINITY_DN14216_c0_g1~~TRINITY_DN14216_c0_g1_i1.p1  ORF type:complete len:607 (-),score=85.73 TRINITY_DN14216_c0_g1_i1:220-2040(-)
MALIVDHLSVCNYCWADSAVVHCIDCGQDFCVDCAQVLHFRRSFRNHTRQPILLGTANDSGDTFDKVLCDNDGNSTAFLHCTDCDTNLCLECDAILHLHDSRAQHRREELSVRDTRVKCTWCHLDEASALCSECDMKLCQDCDEVLHMRAPNREHERKALLTRKDPRKANITLVSSKQYNSMVKCQNDLNADAIVFCPICRLSLCIECDAIIHLSEDKWAHTRQPLMSLPGDDGGRLTGPRNAFEGSSGEDAGADPAAVGWGAVGARMVPNRIKDAIALFRGKPRQLNMGAAFNLFPKCCGVMKAHTGSQGAIASCWSPSGDMILTGGADSLLRLWDAESAAEIQVTEGHKHWVLACDIHPMGQVALSTSRDETLRLWDMRSWQCQSVTKPHGSRNSLVAKFSPRGSMVLTGSTDTKLKLWDAQTMQQLHLLKGHKGWVTSAAFVHDESTVISCSRDYDLRLWDTRSGYACVGTLRAHKKDATCLAVSPDGQYAVTGSRDCMLKAWDLRMQKELMAIEAHGQEIYSCCFTADGKWLASSSKDGNVNIWDTKDLSPVAQCQGHQSAVYSCAASPMGRYMASVSKDSYLRTWAISDWVDQYSQSTAGE